MERGWNVVARPIPVKTFHVSEEHAVVIGGSLAGLLAARVLSETVERVTIVDRDEMPTAPVHRKGVPQSRHTHGLLAGDSRSSRNFCRASALTSPSAARSSRICSRTSSGTTTAARCGAPRRR
jgi:glycine/D-amino acid oxidase-like deaminating enzyme